MPTLSTFELFPSLPAELRLKIWSYTICEPRTVQIVCHKVLSSLRPKLAKRRVALSFSSTTSPPIALHICQEARQEALQIYTPAFSTEKSPNYTYINFKNDMVYLADVDFPYVGEKELARIEMLKLTVTDTAYFGHYNMEKVVKMARLRELEIWTVRFDAITWHVQPHPVSDGLWNVRRDFEEARRVNAKWGWCCPKLRIVEKTDGKVIEELDGGVLEVDDDVTGLSGLGMLTV